jgi:hypothetical protein
VNGLRAAWLELKDQWADSARLRLACWAVLAILWVYGLQMLDDNSLRERSEIAALRAKVSELRALQDAAIWERRLAEAQEQARAVKALTWVESRRGLAQAEIQDWVRTVATKAGLGVRDLRVAGGEDVKPTDRTGGTSNTVSLRLSVDFNATALSAFLFELGQVERGIVVERLQLKTWTTPQQADVDVRVRVGTTPLGT